MDPNLLNILQRKPVVEKAEGVKIRVGQAGKEAIRNDESKVIETKVVDRRGDTFFNREEFTERLKQSKMSKVVSKIDTMPAKPVVPDTLPISKKTVTKLPSKIVLEEEEELAKPLAKPEVKATAKLVIEGEDESPPLLIESDDEEILVPMPESAKQKRTYAKREKQYVDLGPIDMIRIGDTIIKDRLPKEQEKVDIKVSSYFMNNREYFINFINSLFEPYREITMDETKNITCDTIGQDTGEVSLLTHQRIVRDYINLYTPYRGLLLFHGLGSGKTCSSIAIAEGLKSSRQVIVMTPASLRRNYLEEIKKCGDLIYRKNQFWEFIPTGGNAKKEQVLAKALGFVDKLGREETDFIRKQGGAWLVNVTKPSNFETLESEEKKSLDRQIDAMIERKYKFINYNGLRRDRFRDMTNNYENNIFDDSVVIIDEAHNLVSRIVNKINKMSKTMIKEMESNTSGFDKPLPTSLALQLYEFLLRAKNCRIVLLSGTPIINYPNEIGILFNILRGYIKTWQFRLDTDVPGKKITKETIGQLFSADKTVDYVDYQPTSRVLTITRNPFGFESKITGSGYKGVTGEKKERVDPETGAKVLDERGMMSDEEFIKKIVSKLMKEDIKPVQQGSSFTANLALPDKLEEFTNYFLDKTTGAVTNIEKFKKRIMGLTSYFRSAQEELLPRYDKVKDTTIDSIPMSMYQFKVYEAARHEERKAEKPTKGKVDTSGLFKDSSSTYRIFSRMACNFVMPAEIGRPIPKKFRAKAIVDATGTASASATATATEVKKGGQNGGETPPDEEPVGDALEEPVGEALEEEIVVAPKAKVKKTVKFVSPLALAKAKTETTLTTALEATATALDLPEEDILEGLDLTEDEFVLPEIKDEDAKNRDEDELEGDEVLELAGDATYKAEITKALQLLKRNAKIYLSPTDPRGLQKLSPKFLRMLENIQSPENPGLHLIYSQFRSMEGIGIFTMVLEANGFARFKIRRSGTDGWDLDMAEEDIGKPTYALYTGTEEAEEREIIRNIYNGAWKYVPTNIARKLARISNNNNMGEIIKVLMITAAGSEGINLRNTRFVHIMEPYWHPVRVEQVIGRARRICSHQDLPPELQTVEVFIYLMTLTPEQLKSDEAIELKLKDQSRFAPYRPLTSDENLFEISTIKEGITNQLTKGIKESSIDCAVHVKSSRKEGLQCLSFGNPKPNSFSYNPSYAKDENDTVSTLNKTTIKWEGRELMDKNGRKFVINEQDNYVYDYESYIAAKTIPGANPIRIGRYVVINGKGKIEKLAS